MRFDDPNGEPCNRADTMLTAGGSGALVRDFRRHLSYLETGREEGECEKNTKLSKRLRCHVVYNAAIQDCAEKCHDEV